MKREFIVALRNDQGLLLVLQKTLALPVFPEGVIIATDSVPKTIAGQIRAETGLVIGGLHLTSVGKGKPGLEVHRFTAHVAGGALLPFPTVTQADARFLSASWLAPMLVPCLMGATTDMMELVRDLISGTYIRPAQP